MPPHVRGQNIGDVAPGVRASGMHDAVARVAAFASEVVVEADAEASQLGDPGRSLGRQELDGGGSTQTAACRERVCCVEGGIVVPTDRGGHSSLSRIAVRARVGRLGEHEHRGAAVGRCEGGGQTGDAGSDDENVTPLAFLPHKR
jgi:hypothetical protein